MCTLTYLPHGDDFAMASSRDEQRSRGAMVAPVLDAKWAACFPMDAASGGTWFLDKPGVLTLNVLNGGYVVHRRTPPYKHSRGLVPLQFVELGSTQRFLSEFGFEGLEPFSLVVVEHEPRRVSTIVWTGTIVDHIEQDPGEPHIWSSATLYDEAARSRRVDWFKAMLSEPTNERPIERLLRFHRSGGSHWPDATQRILMQRGNDLGTICHVAVEHSTAKDRMYFHDLIDGHEQWIDLRG